ncbi:MAG: 4-hydroxy-tetrahydrodipicolinate synthase [Candidatus Nanohaloarchaea archaeon]
MIKISNNVNTKFRPEGVYPALPTPIADDNSINYEAAEKHIRYLEKEGVHGLVPAGCTGHAASLGDEGGDDLFEEHVEFVRRISEMTDLPIIAGSGMNTTQQAIDLARAVENNADIDAHLSISPYQNCPPQDMIVEHYRQIAESVDKPIIAYNVPGRTGRNIKAETTKQLSEIDGLIGIKEASLDHHQIYRIGKMLQISEDNFELGSGDDAANHFVFEQGGSFAISVSANVHPSGVVDVWRKGYKEGNHLEAYQRNQELMPIHEAMFQEGEKNPISVQYALNCMGFNFGTPRGPLSRKPQQNEQYQNREEIKKVLRQFDLLEKG